jgi:hypothetical protein
MFATARLRATVGAAVTDALTLSAAHNFELIRIVEFPIGARMRYVALTPYELTTCRILCEVKLHA